MKTLIEWLFGLVKRSPALQGALAGVAFAHFVVLAFWAMTWLINFLPWPKA
jgi:hypothetical protein